MLPSSHLKKTFKQYIKYLRYYLLFLLFIFVLLFIIYGAVSGKFQYYTLLSNAFLSGHLYFSKIPYAIGSDTVFYHGYYYWPLGPFPAVVLMPFVWIFHLFGYQFYEAYLHFFIFLATFITYYRISRVLKYSEKDSLFWSTAYCFASPLIGIAVHPFSWYFAHNLASFFAALSIYLFLTKRSYWLIGLLLGAALATRPTAGLLVLFFVLNLVIPPRQKLVIPKLFALLVPVFVSIMLVGWYNYARFGNLFESGYSMQRLFSPELDKARTYGLMSLAHLPGNLYYFLLHGPIPVLRDGVSPVLKPPFFRPDPWGMGILFTSPYFIYLFFLQYRDRLSKILLVSIFLSALPVLLFFGIGYYQYGYRFSLDFLPLVMFLLMRNYRQNAEELSSRFRILIIFAIFCNLYLILSMFSRTT